jgi:hypothetical protein
VNINSLSEKSKKSVKILTLKERVNIGTLTDFLVKHIEESMSSLTIQVVSR